MLDFTALQARVQYTRNQFEQEAAYEHLLRQLRTTQEPAARPTGITRRGRLLLAGLVAAGLLIALVPAPATDTVEASMPAAAAVASTTAEPMLSSTAGSGCWITGDLIGEANPATIGSTLCGR